MLTDAAVPDPVNCVVVPIHADKVPVITGNELTVMFAVTVQPLLFVYVIVDVPDETPVTKPVLLTVATAVFEDTHGVTAAAVAEAVNCVVPFTHAVNVPVIVGKALIVTVAVVIQPLLFV